jgi:hypothetical protein
MLAQALRQLAQDALGEPRVEVVAAETRVAVGREHLEDAGAEPQDRHVEGAPAEVVDGDDALVAAVEPVGERRRGGLVHEPQDVESRELAGGPGRLALAVVEVGRHGDDGALDRLAERRFGAPLELAQDVRRDLGRRELASAGRDANRAAAVARRDEAVAAAILVGHVLVAEAHEPLDR